MTKGYVITIILAVLGWAFALVGFFKKRIWQKKDNIANKRFEAYSQFLKQVDGFGKNMKAAPIELIEVAIQEFWTNIKEEKIDNVEAVNNISTKVFELLQRSVEPLFVMNQELSALRLVASDEMLIYIDKMKQLAEDLSNDFYSSFDQTSSNNIEQIGQKVASIGNSERAKQFEVIYKEMTSLMRQEINIS